MTVGAPNKTNFLYRIQAGNNLHLFTNIAENQIYNGESYTYELVKHSTPRFSEDPQDAEIDFVVKATNPIAMLWVIAPPPYSIVVTILEYDRIADTATPYYEGWTFRPRFELEKRGEGFVARFRLKTLWHFFSRESLSSSLSILSRYAIYDPRSGVDWSALRTPVVATVFNNERDEITVTGITQADDFFTGGMIVSPDQDKRTILTHRTDAGNKKLLLNGAFSQFSLDVGFPADIYPGDDLQYVTWANKFAVETNFGEKWGGWRHTPNVDPATKGLL